ncbi:MAG TPA: tripartite tricarboxylate transporter substrate binding protein [Ramlibacter sp.]|uniref:Bug family tripartite tricarboxylate transporter substrate binding protein n=1 Tax=Ramlibacter sp. TaxID=1917967 RepID=UPI002CC533DF|nr:tripartite tricarboxylate transporter substrate binding protein [Ramlibacter sp.]HVZ45481.1 tripartite tricarboxylate transporter substrate binding protein [Ramlibacter sp.]
MNLLQIAASAMAALAFVAPARAEYPDHPVKMVVAWPAGGGTDSVARIIAKHLSDRLHQQVIVDNRSGASGQVGTEYVARAAPDGYTIQYTVADSHSINPHVFPHVRYDALKDFRPVALVGSMPNALVVNPKIAANNIPEFVKLAKANPGKLTYSTWGVGSGGHIRTEAFCDATGISMLHVPYQGSGPAFQAAIAGQVDVTMVPLGLALANARAGKVKILGVDTTQRVADAPEVPTFTEQGVPLTLAFWQGILVPAKTPDAVVERLNREMKTVLADPETRAELTRVGVTIGGAGVSSIQDLDTYMKNEYERWGRVIKAANIHAEQ